MSRSLVIYVVISLIIGAGLGFISGWFGKATNEEQKSEADSIELIKNFNSRVSSQRLGDNLKIISEKPHYATSQGDYELVAMVKEHWSRTLDSAWTIDYDIMHQYPVEDKTFAKLITVDQEINLAKREDIEEDDIIMFYNAWSPPTSYDVNENDEAIDATISVTKLVYGHYCTAENAKELEEMEPGIFMDSIVICKYGNGGRADKPSTVKPYGALAVLQFSDPYDYSDGNETGFPSDAGIPWDTVQRGSSKYTRGDPTTPGFPSIPGIKDIPIKDILKITKEKSQGPHKWAPLPQQPISITDAQSLISSLNGTSVPVKWNEESGLKLENIGGTLPSGGRFDLQISPKYERKLSQIVVGYLEGSEYPDEYILVGNHRDSWVHGAVDPSSGTTTVFEVTNVLKEMGYRPKRSIIFCSWGSEEFGLMGSHEFVEEFSSTLRERALVYINSDVSFEANGFFRSAAPPILHDFIYEAASLVPDHINSAKTVYDRWLENVPDEITGKPLIIPLGTGSDHAPFAYLAGLSCIDFTVTQNKRSVGIYSTYHTAYDNFQYVTEFVDPGFKAAKMATQMLGTFVIQLGEADLISISSGGIKNEIETFVAAIDADMQSFMSDGQFTALVAAAEKYSSVVQDLADKYTNSKSRRLQNRLLSHSKHFVADISTHPLEEDLRNVLYSPRREGGPTTFPGISNYYQFIKETEQLADLSNEEKIDQFQLQVSALITRLNAVTSYLTIEQPFAARTI